MDVDFLYPEDCAAWVLVDAGSVLVWEGADVIVDEDDGAVSVEVGVGVPDRIWHSEELGAGWGGGVTGCPCRNVEVP